jgi:hypothetical protein
MEHRSQGSRDVFILNECKRAASFYDFLEHLRSF